MKVTVLESVLAVRWCFSMADCNIYIHVYIHIIMHSTDPKFCQSGNTDVQ